MIYFEIIPNLENSCNKYSHIFVVLILFYFYLINFLIKFIGVIFVSKIV